MGRHAKRQSLHAILLVLLFALPKSRCFLHFLRETRLMQAKTAHSVLEAFILAGSAGRSLGRGGAGRGRSGKVGESRGISQNVVGEGSGKVGEGRGRSGKVGEIVHLHTAANKSLHRAHLCIFSIFWRNWGHILASSFFARKLTVLTTRIVPDVSCRKKGDFDHF